MRNLILCLFLVNASCSDKGPPTPTAEQSARLNDTEDMLNDMAQNNEGPEQRPGPSKSNH